MLYDLNKQPLSMLYEGTYNHFLFFNKSYFLNYTVFFKNSKHVFNPSFKIKIYIYKKSSIAINFAFKLIICYFIFFKIYSFYKLYLKKFFNKFYKNKYIYNVNKTNKLYNHNLYTTCSFNIKFICFIIQVLQRYIFHIYNFYSFFLNKKLYSFNNIYNIFNIILQKNKNLHLFYLNFFRKIRFFFCKSFRIYLKHKWNPRWYVRKRKVILNKNSLVIPKKFIKKDKEINIKAVYKYYIDESTDVVNESQRLSFLKNFFKFYSLQKFRKPLKLRTYVTLVKPYDNIEVNNFKITLINTNNFLKKSITFYKYEYYHILLDSMLILNNRFFKKYKRRRFFKLSKKRRNISIRRTSRTYTRPVRIIGKFFRKLYNRSFHNFSFKKIFKKIFLFPSTRISFQDIYWLNPVYNIKRSRKRRNKLKNIYNVRHRSRSYNLYKYNNFFPLFAVKRKFFLRYYRPNTKSTTPIYSSYYLYYYLFFLETLCSQKIWLKLNTSFSVPGLIKRYINSVLFIKTKSRLSFGKGFFIKEMYEILWLSLAYRDLSLYASWFKKSMEKLHYKKHRRMIKFLYDTIKNNKKVYLTFSNIKGISCDVRGKLGATGNAKKRHLAFTVGKISITEKKSPLYCYSNIIKTPTGVLGFTFLLMT